MIETWRVYFQGRCQACGTTVNYKDTRVDDDGKHVCCSCKVNEGLRKLSNLIDETAPSKYVKD